MTTPPSNNGTECPNKTGDVETFYCDPTGCPVDCVGYWTPATTCACVVNTSTQTFVITTQVQFAGQSCGFLNGTVNTSTCTPSGCPVDCQGHWGSWTTCDCNGKTQNRTFIQDVAKEFAGQDCNPAVGTLTTQSCEPSGCPVDCEGFYSSFSVCDCATNKSARTFTITTNSSNGGTNCNVSNGQVEEVNCVAEGCPANCSGTWSGWSTCSCSNNQYNRTYTVTEPARNGGAGCEADNGDVGYGSCEPVNCPVPCEGAWTQWGGCSCVTSLKNRTFIIYSDLQHGGTPCTPPTNNTLESTGCTPSGCPVDCNGTWTSWSTCSCVTGNITRTYQITTPKQNAGADCPYTNGAIDQQGCDTSFCPVDCQGNWNSWTACACSNSRQTRTWNVSVASANGGAACPGQQAQPCEPSGCPVNCEGAWGQWGSCPCGPNGSTSSTKNRTYYITVAAEFGGKACDYTNETVGNTSCTAQNCPVDCQGEWGEWGNCSCKTQIRSRTFTITTNQSNGGTYCDADNNAQGTENCDPTGCKIYPPSCTGPDDETSCVDSSMCTVNKCILFDDDEYHCDWSTPVDCNDNSVCTSDSCDEIKGCVYIPLICNDNTACTTDSCNNVTGCVFTNITCTVNATEWCSQPICDSTTGCGKVQKLCPDQGNHDNCTQIICDPKATSASSACKATQLCGFNPFVAAAITAGAIAGIAVACGIVALCAVSGASYAIATQTGAVAATHTQGNPLYEANHAAGTNLMGENPN